MIRRGIGKVIRGTGRGARAVARSPIRAGGRWPALFLVPAAVAGMTASRPGRENISTTVDTALGQPNAIGNIFSANLSAQLQGYGNDIVPPAAEYVAGRRLTPNSRGIQTGPDGRMVFGMYNLRR